MKKQFRLTKEGVAELKAELATLTENRAKIADAIKTAREFGDLAENAEYQSARQEQERNENRIGEIEYTLNNYEIIRAPKGKTKVQLGSMVKLKGGSSKNAQFQVVSTVEADPLEGKISDESPIGQALLGKSVGDSVEIKTPADVATYKLAEIS
jgi:transcription elongation factor GreA